MKIENMAEVIQQYEVLYSFFRIGHQFSETDRSAVWQAVRDYEMDEYEDACSYLLKNWATNKRKQDVYPPDPSDVAERCRIIRDKRKQTANAVQMAKNRALPPMEPATETDRVFNEKMNARQIELIAQGLDPVKAMLQATMECL